MFPDCCFFHSAPYVCHCSFVHPGGRPPGGKGRGGESGIGTVGGLPGGGKGFVPSSIRRDRRSGNYCF